MLKSTLHAFREDNVREKGARTLIGRGHGGYIVPNPSVYTALQVQCLTIEQMTQCGMAMTVRQDRQIL